MERERVSILEVPRLTFSFACTLRSIYLVGNVAMTGYALQIICASFIWKSSRTCCPAVLSFRESRASLVGFSPRPGKLQIRGSAELSLAGQIANVP